MSSAPIRLPIEFLHSAFPFHVAVDRALNIAQVGDGLSRRYPDIRAGSPLLEHFRLLRPRSVISFDNLSRLENVLLVLQSLHDPLKLKGAISHLAETDLLLFLGSPWIANMNEAEALGVSGGDFPIHDSAGDYLLSLQVHQTALQDTRQLAEELKQQRSRLAEANQQLRAQSAQLSSIIATAVDGIVVVDEKGFIDIFNPAAEAIFGYTADEMAGRNISTLMPDESRSPHQDDVKHLHREYRKWANVAGDAPATGNGLKDFLDEYGRFVVGKGRQTYAQRKNGEIFPVELSISEMDVGGKFKFTGIVRDITERVRMERELSEREQFYSHIYRRAPIMVHSIDNNLKITSVNDYWLEVHGYTREEVVGRAAITLLTEESARYAAVALKDIHLKQGYFNDVFLNVVRKDGSVMETLVSGVAERDMDGEVTGALIISLDVTERRQAERALEESERRNRRILASTLDAVILMDEHGRITEWNDRAETLFGWSRGVMIGQRVRDFLIPPRYREAHAEAMERYLKTGEGPILNQRIEITALKQDGSEFPIEMTVSPIQFSGKTFFCAFIQDITARKQEVEIGARIQQTLLTRRPPTSVSGLQIAARSTASQRIGGDYFDFFTFGKTRLDLVVADIMGKGIPAALLGAGSKSLFQRVIRHLSHSLSEFGRLPEAREIVNSVHKLFTPDLINLNSYLTLCYAQFDIEQSICHFVDCGHPRVIHYRKKTEEVVLLNGENLPIGFSKSEIYTQHAVPFESGDVFIFYSDGVTEALSPAGRMLGEEGLIDIIRSAPSFAPDDILERLYLALEEFTRSGEVSDDRTVVVVRTTGEKRPMHTQRRAVELKSDLNELDGLVDSVKDFCVKSTHIRNDSDILHEVALAVSEAFVNVVEHAYMSAGSQKVLVELEISPDALEIQMLDWGAPFTWSPVYEPALDKHQEGGFGLYIIENCMDRVTYDQDGVGRNRLILVKSLVNLLGKAG